MAGELDASILEPEMVVIPEGEFLMGSDDGEANERPVHSVWIDQFALAIYPVTNSLFQLFVGQTDRRPPPGWTDNNFEVPDQPVTSVNWFEAADYCKWLSSETGRMYRLPTEAEWERAARGGLEGKRYPWGEDPPRNQPGYFEMWKNGPERVGVRPPNGFGVYGISENVHEWCLDWYDPDYYRVSPYRNPSGPASGSRRASRGGSWRHQIKISRVSARSSIPPEYCYSDYGFRCALTL